MHHTNSQSMPSPSTIQRRDNTLPNKILVKPIILRKLRMKSRKEMVALANSYGSLGIFRAFLNLIRGGFAIRNSVGYDVWG